MAPVKIRRGTERDVGSAADLIVRTKRLNNEFDPLFMVVEDSRERAEKYVSDSLRSPEVLLLVATRGEKVVGVLRAQLRNRVFYHPTREGHITDFYVLPEFRRKTLGNDMLEKVSEQLKRMGAEMITAEVPSQNEIAVRFYTKRGFRSLMQVFAGRSQ
ncbi:MAG: GNAT family N-acetyltransferase [Nitrososphaerales archaeon]|nr:GNAT family N-acetyltransferase [Nitrososphaerales archaeon]